MTFSVVLASTIPETQQLDSRRTAYIFSEEAVQELAHQITRKHSQGMKMNVLIRALNKTLEDNTVGVLFDNEYKNSDPKYNEIRAVGEIISATIRHNPLHDLTQCVAEIHFNDEEVASALSNKKVRARLCIVPEIGIEKGHEDTALKHQYLDPDDSTDRISYLTNDFHFLFANIAEKRGVSNPFLEFI